MNEIERRLAENRGVLIRSAHRDLAVQLDSALRSGRLVAPYRGVYIHPAHAGHLGVQVAATAAWAGPDAVLAGGAAARLTFWPSCPAEGLLFAQRVTSRRDVPGVRFERRRIPPGLIAEVDGLRVTRPALTAIDLAAGPLGGDAIDAVLRARAATLDELHQALAATRRRVGNGRRRLVLADSRDEPWSAAERVLQRVFRAAGVTGWSTNVAIGPYVVDIVFRRERVVVEVDGWETHGSRTAFQLDRERRNELEVRGYLVLNVTWFDVTQRPEAVLDWVARARASRRAPHLQRR